MKNDARWGMIVGETPDRFLVTVAKKDDPANYSTIFIPKDLVEGEVMLGDKITVYFGPRENIISVNRGVTR
jgi:hypothetical protein